MTWAQLGRHKKPIVLADIDGFWQPLVEVIRHMNREAFIREGFEVRYHVARTAADILPTVLAAAGHNGEIAGDAETIARM
jgi:predicted Rossmann-fold nucleotide-binding protein